MAESSHILLVDDNADLLMMMSTMLKMSGFNVSTRDSGVGLENALQELAPDLLLMDMLLSGADGRELCKQLKSNSAFQHIPIIMISAHPNARGECLAAGADEFVEKPFNMKEFLNKIRAMLAK